jgi:hypothetical protein
MLEKEQVLPILRRCVELVRDSVKRTNLSECIKHEIGRIKP